MDGKCKLFIKNVLGGGLFTKFAKERLPYRTASGRPGAKTMRKHKFFFYAFTTTAPYVKIII